MTKNISKMTKNISKMIPKLSSEVVCVIVWYCDGQTRQSLSLSDKELRTLVLNEHKRLLKGEFRRIIKFLASVESPSTQRFIDDSEITWNIQEDSVDAYFFVLTSALSLITSRLMLQILLFFIPDLDEDVNLYLILVCILIDAEENEYTMSNFTYHCFKTCIKYFHPNFYSSSSVWDFLHPTVKIQIKPEPPAKNNEMLSLVNCLPIRHDNFFVNSQWEIFQEHTNRYEFYGCHREIVNYSEDELIDLIKKTKSSLDSECYNILYPSQIIDNIGDMFIDFLHTYHTLDILQLFDSKTLHERAEKCDHPHYLLFPRNHHRSYFDRLRKQMESPYYRYYTKGINHIMTAQRLIEFHSIHNKNYFDMNVKQNKKLIKVASVPHSKWKAIVQLSKEPIWTTTCRFFGISGLDLILNLSETDEISDEKLEHLITLGHIYFYGLNLFKLNCLGCLIVMNNSAYPPLIQQFNQIIRSTANEEKFLELFHDDI